MSLHLSQLKPSPKSKQRSKRVGRGNASGHGTYSCRGQKGQRSRSGGKKGLKLKGIRSIIKRLPKLKGFQSFHPKFSVINLKLLDQHFKDGEIVNPTKLFTLGTISSPHYLIKILGNGKISKKLIVSAHAFSKNAENAIKKAGGKTIKL